MNGGKDQPLTPSITDGFKGSVILSGGPAPIGAIQTNPTDCSNVNVSIEVDINGDGDSNDLGESIIAEIDIAGEHISVGPTTLPTGTDQIFLDTSGVGGNDACVIQVTLYRQAK